MNANGGNNFPFLSAHPNGANFLFGDGSVHSLANNTSLLTLQYLASIADGNAVTLP